MIVYRSWKRTVNDGGWDKTVVWEGWFLFGIIPLYLRRIA